MPFNNDLYKGNVRSYYRNWEELNKAQETIDEKDRLIPFTGKGGNPVERCYRANNRLNFFDDLGWEPDSEGNIPKDAAGNSRMFFLKADDQGVDRLVEYDGKSPKLGSLEFWDQVQRGGCYAYPAGDSKPVQVKVSLISKGVPTISYSRPLKPEDLPVNVPKKPSSPNFFKSMIHGIFKNAWKAEFDQYAKDKAAYDLHAGSRNTIIRQLKEKASAREKLHDQEMKDVQKIKDTKAEKARQEEMDKHVTAAQEYQKRADPGKAYFEAVFEPEPLIYENENTLKAFPGRTTKDPLYNRLFKRQEMVDGKIESMEGLYKADQFAELKPITKNELDLDAIRLGNSGKSVTKSDFCALSVLATTQKNIASKGRPISQAYDPHTLSAMKKLKLKNGEPAFTEEEAEKIESSLSNMHYTTDYMEKPPRDKCGMFIKDVINPARMDVKDRLNQYQSGDAKPLGTLIAHGVNYMGDMISSKNEAMGSSYKVLVNASAHLLEMMEADPKLKEEAIKAGMDEKNLLAARGQVELVKMEDKAAGANLKLAQAGKSGTALKPEEKLAAMKDILKFQIAQQSYVLENKGKVNPRLEQLRVVMVDQAIGSGNSAEDIEYLKNESKYQADRNRPAPPEGRMYQDSAGPAYEWAKNFFSERPFSVMMLNSKTYQDNIEKAAEHIIAQDKLMDLDEKSLYQRLDLLGPVNTETGFKGMQYMNKNDMLTDKAINGIMTELKTGKAAGMAGAEKASLHTEQKVQQNGPEKQAGAGF